MFNCIRLNGNLPVGDRCVPKYRGDLFWQIPQRCQFVINGAEDVPAAFHVYHDHTRPIGVRVNLFDAGPEKNLHLLLF